MPTEGIGFKAAGNISPSTFVKGHSAAWQVVAAGAGTDKTLGIATEATRDAPITGQSVYAGIDGDQIPVYLPGNVCLLKAGTGGWTVFAELESGAAGVGIAVTGAGVHEVGAIALEAAAENEFGQVLVVRYCRTIA